MPFETKARDAKLDHRELYRYDLNLDFESDTRRFGTLLKCPRIMEATQLSYHCLWYVPDLESESSVNDDIVGIPARPLS